MSQQIEKVEFICRGKACTRYRDIETKIFVRPELMYRVTMTINSVPVMSRKNSPHYVNVRLQAWSLNPDNLTNATQELVNNLIDFFGDQNGVGQAYAEELADDMNVEEPVEEVFNEKLLGTYELYYENQIGQIVDRDSGYFIDES